MRTCTEFLFDSNFFLSILGVQALRLYSTRLYAKRRPGPLQCVPIGEVHAGLGQVETRRMGIHIITGRF